MKRILALGLSVAALAITVLGVESACNNVGVCPSASSIKPGGSCSGDYLECPYTLQTPSQACDGTSVEGGLATSCVCTNGTWVCPDPVSCEGGSGDGGADGEVDGTTDGQGGEAATEDGGGDGEVDSASAETGAGDATGDADGAVEGATDGAADSPADVTGQ